ncbi:hypothetical protein RU639_013671 [Aspergillus parasiticus]
MACFWFLHAILPPCLRRFCPDRRSPVGLMDWDNGPQDDSKSATSHDKPLSGSSEYQTPRPLSYEEGQPNPPAPVKSQKYSLFPKQSQPPSAPKMHQRIKPASPADSGEEAIAAIPDTLRKDQAPTNRTIRTSTSSDSGQTIFLPTPDLPEPKQVCCGVPMIDDLTSGQIVLLGYKGVRYPSSRGPIMVLSVMYRGETKMMGCSLSFFNGKGQGALRETLSQHLEQDERLHVYKKYGFQMHA